MPLNRINFVIKVWATCGRVWYPVLDSGFAVPISYALSAMFRTHIFSIKPFFKVFYSVRSLIVINLGLLNCRLKQIGRTKSALTRFRSFRVSLRTGSTFCQFFRDIFFSSAKIIIQA